MRQIKFRGRFWNKANLDSAETDYTDGDIVYGGYARIKFVFSEGYGDYILTERLVALLVYPESVAQLVGHDINGREVYEGDLLIDEAGIEHTALLSSVHQDEQAKFFFWEYPSRLKLKEAQS